MDRHDALPQTSVAPGELLSVVVASDLSSRSKRLLERVARLPLSKRVRLTLVHAVPKSLPRSARQSAKQDATNALADEAKQLTKAAPRGAVVESVVRIGTAASEIVACAAAMKADLIVVGRGEGRALRDAFIGSTAERVLRNARVPVLVVRLPARAPYRRPTIALELDEAAREAVFQLLRIVSPPYPKIRIVHAYDIPYRTFVYPSLTEAAAKEFQDLYERRAAIGIHKVLVTALARRGISQEEAPRWKLLVKYGSPRSVIERIVKKTDTDLLVLGTHGYSGIAQAFLGTVAGDVLRAVDCDVLLVPPGEAPSSSSARARA